MRNILEWSFWTADFNPTEILYMERKQTDTLGKTTNHD